MSKANSNPKLADPADPGFSQEDRELAVALRVQAMTDKERGAWLANEWGRLQRNAASFQVNAPEHLPTARSYASMQEKNQFDEARELQFAMQYSVFATQRVVSLP